MSLHLAVFMLSWLSGASAFACDELARTCVDLYASELEAELVDALGPDGGPVTHVALSADASAYNVRTAGPTDAVEEVVSIAADEHRVVINSAPGGDGRVFAIGGRVTKIVVSSGGLDYSVAGGDDDDLGEAADAIAAALRETKGTISNVTVSSGGPATTVFTANSRELDGVGALAAQIEIAFRNGGRITKIVVSSGGLDYASGPWDR